MKNRPVLTIIIAIPLLALIPGVIGPLIAGNPEDILPFWIDAGVLTVVLYFIGGVVWFVERGLK